MCIVYEMSLYAVTLTTVWNHITNTLVFCIETACIKIVCCIPYRFLPLYTYSIEQSPSWETNRPTASQEISRILWNSKVYHRIYNSPPPVHILSQIDPFYVPSHFSEIHFNIILPSTPGSSKWYLSLRFPHQNSLCTSLLPHTSCMFFSFYSFVKFDMYRVIYLCFFEYRVPKRMELETSVKSETQSGA